MRSSTCEMVLINRQARLRERVRECVSERERERPDQRSLQLEHQQCSKEVRSVQMPSFEILSVQSFRKPVPLKKISAFFIKSEPDLTCP